MCFRGKRNHDTSDPFNNNWKAKVGCRPSCFLSNICEAYRYKSQEFSKLFTEQITVVLLSLLAVIAICATDVIKVPFSDKIPHTQSNFIEIVLALNVGRYVYMVIQDAFLFYLIDKTKFRTDTVHHVVTIVCNFVILAYKQNMLLGILGILTELNTLVIAMTKIMKTLGYEQTSTYRKMSIVSCVVTIAFRAVIPVLFLVMGMFHETPFVMHYAALTVFFLSIIFFSVINVWLVLSTVQRMIKIYGYTSNTLPSYTADETQFCQIGRFNKNYLGYERPLGNININYDADKLNIKKKDVLKVNITNAIRDSESEVYNIVENQNNVSENSIRAVPV